MKIKNLGRVALTDRGLYTSLDDTFIFSKLDFVLSPDGFTSWLYIGLTDKAKSDAPLPDTPAGNTDWRVLARGVNPVLDFKDLSVYTSDTSTAEPDTYPAENKDFTDVSETDLAAKYSTLDEVKIKLSPLHHTHAITDITELKHILEEKAVKYFNKHIYSMSVSSYFRIVSVPGDCNAEMSIAGTVGYTPFSDTVSMNCNSNYSAWDFKNNNFIVIEENIKNVLYRTLVYVNPEPGNQRVGSFFSVTCNGYYTSNGNFHNAADSFAVPEDKFIWWDDSFVADKSSHPILDYYYCAEDKTTGKPGLGYTAEVEADGSEWQRKYNVIKITQESGKNVYKNDIPIYFYRQMSKLPPSVMTSVSAADKPDYYYPATWDSTLLMRAYPYSEYGDSWRKVVPIASSNEETVSQDAVTVHITEEVKTAKTCELNLVDNRDFVIKPDDGVTDWSTGFVFTAEKITRTKLSEQGSPVTTVSNYNPSTIYRLSYKSDTDGFKLVVPSLTGGTDTTVSYTGKIYKDDIVTLTAPGEGGTEWTISVARAKNHSDNGTVDITVSDTDGSTNFEVSDTYTAAQTKAAKDYITQKNYVKEIANISGSVNLSVTKDDGTVQTVNIPDLDPRVTTLENTVKAMHSFSISVVSALPSMGAEFTIYLVPKSKTGTANAYDEYMYINSKWELIGDTEIDLSSYLTGVEHTEGLTGAGTAASKLGLSAILETADTFTKYAADQHATGTVYQTEAVRVDATNGNAAGATMQLYIGDQKGDTDNHIIVPQLLFSADGRLCGKNEQAVYIKANFPEITTTSGGTLTFSADGTSFTATAGVFTGLERETKYGYISDFVTKTIVLTPEALSVTLGGAVTSYNGTAPKAIDIDSAIAAAVAGVSATLKQTTLTYNGVQHTLYSPETGAIEITDKVYADTSIKCDGVSTSVKSDTAGSVDVDAAVSSAITGLSQLTITKDGTSYTAYTPGTAQTIDLTQPSYNICTLSFNGQNYSLLTNDAAETLSLPSNIEFTSMSTDSRITSSFYTLFTGSSFQVSYNIVPNFGQIYVNDYKSFSNKTLDTNYAGSNVPMYVTTKQYTYTGQVVYDAQDGATIDVLSLVAKSLQKLFRPNASGYQTGTVSAYSGGTDIADDTNFTIYTDTSTLGNGVYSFNVSSNDIDDAANPARINFDLAVRMTGSQCRTACLKKKLDTTDTLNASASEVKLTVGDTFYAALPNFNSYGIQSTGGMTFAPYSLSLNAMLSSKTAFTDYAASHAAQLTTVINQTEYITNSVGGGEIPTGENYSDHSGAAVNVICYEHTDGNDYMSVPEMIFDVDGRLCGKNMQKVYFNVIFPTVNTINTGALTISGNSSGTVGYGDDVVMTGPFHTNSYGYVDQYSTKTIVVNLNTFTLTAGGTTYVYKGWKNTVVNLDSIYATLSGANSHVQYINNTDTNYISAVNSTENYAYAKPLGSLTLNDSYSFSSIAVQSSVGTTAYDGFIYANSTAITKVGSFPENIYYKKTTLSTGFRYDFYLKYSTSVSNAALYISGIYGSGSWANASNTAADVSTSGMLLITG